MVIFNRYIVEQLSRCCESEQIREQISREWIRDLELVSAENTELERHREDAVCRDKESAERDRKMVFDHGEPYTRLLYTSTKRVISMIGIFKSYLRRFVDLVTFCFGAKHA